MKDHAEMKQYIEGRQARGLDVPEIDGREVLDLLEEINIADKIIAERDRLISAIPACPVHGQCVPHAIEWVEKAVLMMRILKAENEALRRGMTGDYDLDAWLEFSTGAAQKDADRYQWLCDGNGYFMEEQGICGHSNEKAEADRQIDIAMNTGERP